MNPLRGRLSLSESHSGPGGLGAGRVADASDDVHEAAGEEAGAAVPLERALEPAVLALPVDEHNVSLLQLQLRLTLGRVGHHHPVPDGGNIRLHHHYVYATHYYQQTSLECK